jgi:hypothetical protein
MSLLDKQDLLFSGGIEGNRIGGHCGILRESYISAEQLWPLIVKGTGIGLWMV